MKKFLTYIACIVLFSTSCKNNEDIEISSNDVYVESLSTTATTAEITISWDLWYAGSNKTMSRLCYGTSPDFLGGTSVMCSENPEFSVGKLYFKLTDLKPSTTYYFAFEPAEFHVNDLILYNDSYKPLMIVPHNQNSFFTGIAYNAVDLGLSVKWCDKNVGANSINHGGQKLTWCTDKRLSITNEPPYFNISGTEYDNATELMGDGWRTPTQTEYQELIDKCDIEVVENNGNRNLIVTGPNGNSITLPVINGLVDDKDNWYSCYWTSNSKMSSYGSTYYGVAFEYSDEGAALSTHIFQKNYYIRAVLDK